MAPSIEHLSRHLGVNSVYWAGGHKYLSGEICLALICYAVKLHSSPEHPGLIDTLTRMEDIARNNHVFMHVKLVDIFVESFIPNVRRLFMVPKVEHLSDHDKRYLKPNEILAGFMNFLIQILDCAQERWFTRDREMQHMHDSLKWGLKLLVAIVEDSIFHCPSHHNELEEEVNNLLKEFEMLVNEAGDLVYSHIILVQVVHSRRFYEGKDALLQMVKLLIEKITKRYIKYSELPMMNACSRFGVVGSFLIIDSLVEDLENMMTNKKNRVNFTFCGREDQTKTLHAGLKFLQDFLKDTTRVTSDTHADMLHEHLTHIANLAYETEQLIYTGYIPDWYLDLRLPAIIHKVKLTNKSLEQMNTGTMKSSDGEVSTCQVHTIGTPGVVSENLSEGFQVNMERILEYLIGGSKTRKIITIHGMPGIGKTTMAYELYSCPLACEHFDRRAWCVISQQFNVRNLLVHILVSIADKPNKDKILEMKDVDLGVNIHKTLMGRRYLIVLDDIWHSELWDKLQIYFPDVGNGSRILLTSRIEAAAPGDSSFHTLPFLSEDQSWDLLAKKIFHTDSCPLQLVSIGRRIAKKCHGVPLTVVATAGILVNLDRNERAWEIVEKELNSLLLDDKSDYRRILELSYEHLPCRMKPCFLYLGAFSEDTEISVRRLFWLWIASGFIQKVEEKSPEEIAETYLLDLINRSLVIITRKRYEGGIKACRVHDLLRDLCIKKAYEENFLASNNNDFSIYEKHQHLSVRSTSSIYQRTVSAYARSLRVCTELTSYNISALPFLRVLDVIPVKSLPPVPLQLNYLGIHSMPTSIVHNLFNLEFLCILKRTEIVSIPRALLKLVKLRHLLIKKEAVFESNYHRSQRTGLRSLGFVGILVDMDEEILRNSPHLKELKCVCGLNREFPVLCSLTELESLKVDFKHVPERTLLSENNFPSAIKKLHISRSVFPWEKISVIGRLPNLHVLKLGPHAFVGKVWETRDGEFQKLRFLKIELSDPRQWIVSGSDHFPRLECLILLKCFDLKEIPGEVGDIETLQRIEVRECGKEMSLTALQIEEEQREYDNEELQIIITNSRWTKESLVNEYELKKCYFFLFRFPMSSRMNQKPSKQEGPD